MEWQITYYNQKLEEKILNLPDALLAKYLWLTDLMSEFGPNLGMPHTKALGGGLCELRVKGGYCQSVLLCENREENHHTTLFC